MTMMNMNTSNVRNEAVQEFSKYGAIFMPKMFFLLFILL